MSLINHAVRDTSATKSARKSHKHNSNNSPRFDNTTVHTN